MRLTLEMIITRYACQHKQSRIDYYGRKVSQLAPMYVSDSLEALRCIALDLLIEDSYRQSVIDDTHMIRRCPK